MTAVKYRLSIFVLLLLSFMGNSAFAQNKHESVVTITDNRRAYWIDSVYNKLDTTERIGQLFMVAAYSGGKNYNEPLITKLIEAHQIGGLIFMQGGPARQAVQTNKYQSIAQVPLLIAMDAEWGLGMRLDSVKDMPRQMELGATRDTAIVYRMATAIAAQCKRLGVHVDFAPVVDVNNNPNNPVINFRSFGEDKTRVSRMGIAYMRGLQDHGVMACAKHFPGHGDTNVDSHQDLPVITKSLAQLDTLELYPFKQMIAAGIKSVMVAHLSIPALETGNHIPTTLSQNTITNLLKNKMNFHGLVFTDALDMKGVAKYFEPGDVDLRAFIAGNDVLLFSQDVPTAINKIKHALDSGIVKMTDIEHSVKKILGVKYDAGLPNFKPISTYHITEDLNQYTASLREDIAKEAITVVRDDNGILNKINGNMRVAYIGVNAYGGSPLHDALKDALEVVPTSWIDRNASTARIDTTLRRMDDNDVNIVAVHNLTLYPKNNYGLDESELAFLEQAQKKSNVMIVAMGNAYFMQNVCQANSIMIGYADDTITQKVAANILLKKIKARGKLPVTSCIGVQRNVVAQQTSVKPNGQLSNTEFIQDAGVKDPEALYKLDMFLQRCVADGAFPGCRVLAAKDGKVFYNKSFGYHTYGKEQRVDTNTMYDMASCTKVLATTISVMRLYETGKISLDKTLGDYLPWVKGTDKAGLHLRDILLHQAGLKAFIPFYKETLDENGNLSKSLYKQSPSDKFSTPVAKNLYIRNDYPDSIWHEILNSPLEKGKYVYSDLDFYFLAAVVKQVTGQSIDKYVAEQFYKPMGLKHITYNPLQNGFTEDNIPPTEDDLEFRHELVRAYVHDPGAAMMGGVEGHAGVFATANDVAAIFQMLMNKGVYKGKRYFKDETVNYFTAYNSRISRRGLGFDKPSADANDGGPSGDRSSGFTFGHQGFTGTCVWADPQNGVVFVFLSNRVYPSATNNKINHLSVRTVSQDYIYEALGIPVDHNRLNVYREQVKGK
jgi:beta-glucosidase-like glycosyl hydrolase/CubicO group peptidase (beta-lactamase class C family)